MNRRSILSRWRALLAAAAAAPAPNAAAIPGSSPPVSTYLVTDPASFPSLPLPAKWQIFLNGQFLTPNVDYTISGSNFKVTAALGSGDRISVVDLS